MVKTGKKDRKFVDRDEKLGIRMDKRKGKGKASDYDKKPKKQESEPSEREINNSLRIIGAMRDILTSQDGDVKEQKKNCGCGQDPCITYGKAVKEARDSKKDA